MTHTSVRDLEAGLDAIRRSPADSGLLRMIVRRPRENEREVIGEGWLDAFRFVNSPVGKQLHLRGVNARVVEPGVVRAGDRVRRLPD